MQNDIRFAQQRAHTAATGWSYTVCRTLLRQRSLTEREIMEPTVDFMANVGKFQLWRGVATFLSCPYETDPAEADIGLVGIPYSGGNGIQRMQYLAPRAVRNMSMGHHRSHRGFQVNPFELCRIRDLGDAPITATLDPERSIDEIHAFFARLHEAGTLPVSIGGDHSVTLPIFRGIAGPKSKHKGPIAMIHLDAHTDAYPTAPGYAPHGGDFVVRAVQEGLIDPKRSVQVGIRGPMADLRQDSWAHETGFRVIETEEFFEIGVKAVIAETRRIVGDGPVYITWDMDAIDPTYAPAVSDPEPDGITIRDATKFLAGLRGLDIVGGDVVEVNPPLDPPGLGITVYHMTHIFYEIVTLIADSLAQRRQAAAAARFAKV